MWRLLLGGIKVIIAIAALTTAANWIAVREQDRAPGPALASVVDPATTGAIAPRRADKAYDQRGLGRLMSEAVGEGKRR